MYPVFAIACWHGYSLSQLVSQDGTVLLTEGCGPSTSGVAVGVGVGRCVTTHPLMERHTEGLTTMLCLATPPSFAEKTPGLFIVYLAFPTGSCRGILGRQLFHIGFFQPAMCLQVSPGLFTASWLISF